MNRAAVIAGIIAAGVLSVVPGCEAVQNRTITSSNVDGQAAIYRNYSPVKAEILPLTEVAGTSDGEWKIKVYVALVNRCAYQVQWPGVFRFELYEYVARSAQPKGQRIAIWPDYDLSEPVVNSDYWKDFLKAYQFELDAGSIKDSSCVLLVTFTSAGGSRISTEGVFRLK